MPNLSVPQAVKDRLFRTISKAGYFITIMWLSFNLFTANADNKGLQAQKDVLHSELTITKNQIKSLEKNLAQIVVQVSGNCFEMDYIALPFWKKIYNPETNTTRMYKFNSPYSRVYGITNLDYFSKLDEEVT